MATKPLLSTTLNSHFDFNQSSVYQHPQNPQLKTLGFGHNLSDADLIKICGAPTGSILHLYYVPASLVHEKTPAGLKVEIENSTYFKYNMELIFYKNNSNEREIYIKLVMTNQGLNISAVGALIVHSILKANDAITLPSRKFHRLAMLGAGGRLWRNRINATATRWDGFAVWPRCGFNMRLRQRTHDIAKEFPYFPIVNKATCKDVSTLLGLNGGVQFWDVAGDGWYMYFKTGKQTDSRKKLASYLGGKYI